ncbi:MAG: formyltransferase family protein [Chloroflexota bacterium]|nr:formyltransferase family protein [Chloroflexota bacterium]MDE2895972.1 formyltransferase family protein [Chloroflexota bacterium]
MRIALIGQAPFGAAVFERLVEDGHEIVGVFTPPEREGGRPDPLAQAARDASITLVQPRRWQRRGVVDEDVVAQYEATNPELNVMAFVTQIIPSRVLDFPPMNTIQYHPSILPKHRGRSAINHSILQGDTMTGVTIFWVDEGIDTGPILLQRACPIGPDTTLNDVYREYLFPLGVETMSEAVKLVEAGQAPRHVQNEADMTYEGPWEGDIARIDWSQDAQTVHNFIRGSDRAPGAWSEIGGQRVTLLGSSRSDHSGGAAGEVAAIGGAGMTIVCGDGESVRVSTLAVGRDRQPAQEWASANGVDVGAVFAPAATD